MRNGMNKSPLQLKAATNNTLCPRKPSQQFLKKVQLPKILRINPKIQTPLSPMPKQHRNRNKNRKRKRPQF